MDAMQAQIHLCTAIGEQRNAALNEVARLQVKLAFAQHELAEYKAAHPPVEPALPPTPVAPPMDPNDYD